MSNFATGDVTVLGNKRVGFKIVDFPSHESVRLLDGQHVAESGNALIEMPLLPSPPKGFAARLPQQPGWPC